MGDDRRERQEDSLSVDIIYDNLSDRRWHIKAYEQIGSTNTMLREQADNLPEFSVVIAGAQTAGRGRRGRSFFSPDGSGLYMSLLLRSALEAERAADITTAAAVAVCEAIEEVLSLKPGIKWVNDIFIDGKKVCGILTEAAFTADCNYVNYVVLGMGINVYAPEGGFPEELRDIAGALMPERLPELRSRLAAAVLERFGRLYDEMLAGGSGYAESYRRRCLAIGRDVTVVTARGSYPAHVYGIDDRCHLLVRLPDGTEQILSSGEISIKL